MIQIDLPNLGIDAILGIVRELRRAGLVQHKHFDFEYHPPSVNWSLANSDGFVNERHTIFKFYREQDATWFVLRFVQDINK